MSSPCLDKGVELESFFPAPEGFKIYSELMRRAVSALGEHVKFVWENSHELARSNAMICLSMKHCWDLFKCSGRLHLP